MVVFRDAAVCYGCTTETFFLTKYKKDGMSLCHYWPQYPKRCILPRRKLWQTAARQWLSSTCSTWTHTPCFAGRGGTPVLIVSGEISVFFFIVKGSNFQSGSGIDIFSVRGLEGSDGIWELLGCLQFIWCSTWELQALFSTLQTDICLTYVFLTFHWKRPILTRILWISFCAGRVSPFSPLSATGCLGRQWFHPWCFIVALYETSKSRVFSVCHNSVGHEFHWPGELWKLQTKIYHYDEYIWLWCCRVVEFMLEIYRIIKICN